MNGCERIVQIYLAKSGRSPFEEWFNDLSDERARDRLLARIARLRLGNPGDWKAVGEGVLEMQIDHGPGYRVYFGQEGRRLVILLCGGDKSTQSKDIKKAKEYWHDYKESKEAEDF